MWEYKIKQTDNKVPSAKLKRFCVAYFNSASASFNRDFFLKKTDICQKIDDIL